MSRWLGSAERGREWEWECVFGGWRMRATWKGDLEGLRDEEREGYVCVNVCVCSGGVWFGLELLRLLPCPSCSGSITAPLPLGCALTRHNINVHNRPPPALNHYFFLLLSFFLPVFLSFFLSLPLSLQCPFSCYLCVFSVISPSLCLSPHPPPSLSHQKKGISTISL